MDQTFPTRCKLFVFIKHFITADRAKEKVRDIFHSHFSDESMVVTKVE